jgi:integrase
MSNPIAKKGSPYWHYDFIVKGARFFGSTGLTSKRAARERIEQIRRDILIAKPDRPAITLDEACGLYANHAEHLPSWPTTRYMLRAMVAGLPKDQFLSKITQRDLIAYIARRRHERANSTVNRELDIIRAVWSVAERARYDVGDRPDWKALRLKQSRNTHRTLSVYEEAPMIAAIRGDVRPAITFLLMSGWRRAEVIGLRWADLDFGSMTAVTPIKGGDVVTRPLTRAMITLIANQPRDGAFVFTYVCQRNSGKDRRAGRRYPLSITVIRDAWDDAVAALLADGSIAKPIRLHDLRHTRATRMLRATGNLATVQAALQHRNVKTTMQYAHVLDQDVRDALEAGDGIEPRTANESRTIPEVIPMRRA